MSAFFDPPRPRQVPRGAYPFWDEALALVNRDLAVALPDQGLLRLVGLPSEHEDETENVYVALADGEWHGNFLAPESADDPVLALSAVTDASQETVTERLWRAWPLCREHDLGMHLREADGRLSWWCAGGTVPREPGHVRAAVGGLDALVRPHRPNRKPRRRG
ncbi:hypothetical protein [Streptomyces sp. TLI_105]|uniref:hypothetical protein n=1 Tax=Streptomyces sp. TLI_105 TaxID=1881019 RepID=UPI00089C3866|nr:hypothetical protein [Streptomyces sp. TLI_105]SEE15267.1 hypothetical protein SAMN05428939_7524 [Streptomyces sp. TLI_105]